MTPDLTDKEKGRLCYLRKHYELTIEVLASKFNVSENTIRREIEKGEFKND